MLPIDLEPESDEDELAVVDDEPAVDDRSPQAKRKRGGKRSGGARKERRLSGESMIGDDLGGAETRELNADQAGGEEQLLGTEIERGFDSVMPQVRRCL